MQKKISLLYKNGVAGEIEKSIEQALYNLNIDRMTRAACDKTKHADYFLSVLCRRCVSEENALYRAAILKDFITSAAGAVVLRFLLRQAKENYIAP